MKRRLRYLSLFSGIGGFDLGFDRAGMECAGQVEYDEKAAAVLERHWPGVKRMSDVMEVRGDEFGTVDVICGGFPCQDLSVAGRRAGLAGKRSGLWFEFHRIIDSVKPGIVVIENVPGLLSSNGGRDFAVILRGLVECGYGVAWRVLDAKYFGVPQRRRRVFIVGSLGDGRAAEILFERERGAGNIAAGRGAGAELALDVAPSLRHGGGNGRGYNLDAECGLTVTAHTLTTETHATGDGVSRGVPIVTTFNGYTGGADDNDAQVGHLVAVPLYYSHDYNQDRIYSVHGAAQAHTANCSGLTRKYATAYGVRRLTPVECERLQGFPDYFTDGQSDSARYRQLGNAVAVPVVQWLGERILSVEKETT
jgi:DNA (cytosine-5)-methyltransferase 1